MGVGRDQARSVVIVTIIIIRRLCRSSKEKGEGRRTFASAHRRRFVNIAPNTTAKNTKPSTSRMDISFVCSFLISQFVNRQWNAQDSGKRAGCIPGCGNRLQAKEHKHDEVEDHSGQPDQPAVRDVAEADV